MLPSQQELSRLLGRLYDAAEDPNLWSPFLQQLAEVTSATSAGFVMLNVGQNVFTMSRSWMVDPEATSLYQEHYGSIDVWAQRGLAKRSAMACTSKELCPQSELRNTEVYNDYMVRFNFEHAMFVVAENTGSRLASVSLYRDSSCPEFATSDLDILSVLTPHVRRVFKLHFKFSELKAQSEGLERAVEMLPVGMIFFGAKGNVIFMNRSATSAVAERDGLLATREGLRAEQAAESSLLEKTIREACATLSGKGLSAGGTVMISRRVRQPLQVQISPITSSVIGTSETIFAVAFIYDPSQRQRPPQQVLQVLYGLTPAECRVALLLGDGRSPRKISETIGVTFNTVRSQMKSIFAKTGVRRQGELIRLLLNSSGLPMHANSTL
jgi:DNA-binding CsgD family transcriptional regulator